MKLLMVQGTSWDRQLGGSRAQLELAEALTAAGHTVDHFSFDDAFPNASSSRIIELVRPDFSRYAERHVRANAHRYDVIDALDGTLGVGKASLRFDGLLVARSIGLRSLYRDALLDSTRRFWAERSRGKPGVRQIRDWRSRHADARSDRGILCADLVSVCNRDEVRYVVETLGVPSERVVHITYGLDENRRRLFASYRGDLGARPAEVVFVGSWDWRKGALEWPRIIRAIHERRPDVRFRLLGTGVPADRVLADLGYGGDPRVIVVPRYRSEELPALLARSTLGVFPSHVEAFGFGVLEMLAAGLPVVAYEAPGPRELLSPVDPTLLTAIGDPDAIAQRALALLEDVAELRRLSAAATLSADAMTWTDVAARTIEIYSERLSRLRSATRSPSSGLQPGLGDFRGADHTPV